MKIQLFQFNKKINSTKRPTGGTEFTITLKEGCDIINPTINLAGVNNPTAYNYAYIPDFKRYYYISNWEANRDRWTASMAVDVLASYRDQIGASTQYVSRAESAYNGNIVDDLYPTSGSYDREEKVFDSVWDGPNTHYGSFVFSIANDVSSPTGASYYVTDYKGFDAIRAILFGESFYDLILNGIWTPGDFVLSCRWFPVIFPVTGGRISAIYMGHLSWDLPSGVNVYQLSNQLTADLATSVQVPRHPQVSTRGNYLKLSPYTKYSVFFPPFGLFDIDAGTLYDIDNITFNVVVDPISGIGTLAVTSGTSLHAVYQNNIGVDIPLVSRDVDVGGLVTNGIAAGYAGQAAYAAAGNITFGAPTLMTNPLTGSSFVGASVTGGLGAAALAAGVAAAAIGNAARSAVPTSRNITGSSGSFAPYSWQPRLISSFIDIVDEHVDAGRPLMASRTINTLAGYVQIPDPHFEIAMTDTEMSTLNHAAISGFFYE